MGNYREIRIRSILIFLYFLVFGIFGFGPGLDGMWTTTGFRALYPFFFEIIVLVSLAGFMINYKDDRKLIINTRLFLLTIPTTLIMYLFNQTRFNKPFLGDEISYINLVKALTIPKSYRLSSEILTSTLLAATYWTILTVGFLCALIYSFRIKMRSRKFILTNITIFIILRQTFNIVFGINYQYPLAFEIPLLLPIFLDFPVSLVRIVWVNFLLLFFVTVIFNSTLLRAQSYRIYIALVIVCLQPNVLDYLTQIEPIWFSIISGTYILAHTLLMGRTTLNYSLVALLATFRLPGLFWLLMTLRYPVSNVHSFFKQLLRQGALFLFITPLLLHSFYRIWLGFFTNDQNQIALGIPHRAVELHASMLSEFGIGYPLYFFLFISLHIFLRSWLHGLNVFAVVLIYLCFLPNGAISHNKYAIEIVVPIQIVLLSTITTSDFLNRILKR